MHQRSSASAVTVPIMRPRDYLFYLLGSGDDPQVAVSLVVQQSLPPIQESCYEIALLTATEEEALRACKAFLERGSSPHEVSKLRQSRHNFHAIALDATWPTRRFHELHWLCGHKASPTNLQSLKGLADIIHDQLLHFWRQVFVSINGGKNKTYSIFGTPYTLPGTIKIRLGWTGAVIPTGRYN